jgi:hypothetical protein
MSSDMMRAEIIQSKNGGGAKFHDYNPEMMENPLL